MRIDVNVLPPASPYKTRKLTYQALLDALTATSAWVRIPLADIKGETLNAKRVNIRHAAERAGVLVQTRSDAEYLYVSKRSAESPDAN